ncbi:hypothetical protein MCEMIH15_00663 [Caulobacteraceae bacterium]
MTDTFLSDKVRTKRARSCSWRRLRPKASRSGGMLACAQEYADRLIALIAEFPRKPFDVLVVGGKATGCGPWRTLYASKPPGFKHRARFWPLQGSKPPDGGA